MRPRCLSLLLVLACLVLPGCGVIENRPPLRIGVSPWPGYEYLYLAREKGFFEKEGGRVQLVDSNSNSISDSRKAYEQGQIDGFACPLVEVLYVMENSRRNPQIVVAVDYSDGADVVVARRSIHNTGELVGRRVGLEPGSANTVLLHRALEAASFSLNDVTMVPFSAAGLVTAMKDGNIDAAATYAPFSTEILVDDAYHVLFSSREIPARSST